MVLVYFFIEELKLYLFLNKINPFDFLLLLFFYFVFQNPMRETPPALGGCSEQDEGSGVLGYHGFRVCGAKNLGSRESGFYGLGVKGLGFVGWWI